MTTTTRQECPVFDVNPTGYFLGCHILSGITIVISSLAIFCIIKKTPTQMKKYSYHLFAYQFLSFIMDLAFSFFGIAVLFPPMPCGYAAGSIIYFPIPTHYKFIVLIVLMYLVAAMTLDLFVVRYQASLLPGHICKLKPKQHFIWFTTFIIFILAILLYELLSLNISNQKELAQQLTTNYTCYDQVIHAPGFLIYNHQEFLSFAKVFIFLVICLAIAIALLIFLTFYSFKTIPMSKSTIILQKKFMKSLCLQTLVPIVFGMVPGVSLFYSIANVLPVSQTVVNSQMLLAASHGVIGSLVMIAATQPYRTFLLSYIPERKKKAIVKDLNTQLSTTIEHIRTFAILLSANIIYYIIDNYTMISQRSNLLFSIGTATVVVLCRSGSKKECELFNGIKAEKLKQLLKIS